MTDTRWHLLGGIGIPASSDQVMTQGIGFPLRPVDGVDQPEDTDREYATGDTLIHTGDYIPGLWYRPGMVARDGEWVMYAIQDTDERPAPQPQGSGGYLKADTPGFSTSSNSSVVWSGQRYNFLQGGWLNRIRVYVPELTTDTHYRIIMITVFPHDPENPVKREVVDPLLVADGWAEVAGGCCVWYRYRFSACNNQCGLAVTQLTQTIGGKHYG